MSLPISDDEPVAPRYRKPQADLYTVLLIIALLALILGIVCLYFINDMYDWKTDGAPRATVIMERVDGEPALAWARVDTQGVADAAGRGGPRQSLAPCPFYLS